MYFEKKHDERTGLTVYRCIRGTNSVESFHQKLVDNCSTYGGSPRYSDAMLAEIRHRYNERASIRNRPQYPDLGHYDTWIVDDIQELCETLRIDDPLINWCSSKSFTATEERYGLVKLSDQFSNLPVFEEALVDTLRPAFAYLAKAMDTKFPLLPIITREEKELYHVQRRNRLYLLANGSVDFEALCRYWNQEKSDGATIFYKVISHFRRYEKIVADRLNTTKTIIQFSDSRSQLRYDLGQPVRDRAITGVSRSMIVTNADADPRLRPGTTTLAPLIPAVHAPEPTEIPPPIRNASGRRPRRCQVEGCPQPETCRGRGRRDSCILRVRERLTIGNQ